MTVRRHHHAAKLFIVFGALLVALGVVWLRATSATWHASILRHIPRALLGAMVTAVVVSITGVCWFTARSDEITAAAALAPFGGAVVLFYELPSLLGYSGRIGDIVVHLSAVNSILVGHKIPDTTYPLSYLSAATIGYAGGVDAQTALTLLTAAAFMCFTLVTAAHGRKVGFPAASAVLFVPATATLYAVPARITYATVFVTTVFLIASAIVTTRQKLRRRYYGVIIIVALPLPLSHPLAAINLSLYIGIIGSLTVFIYYFLDRKESHQAASIRNVVIFVAGLEVLATWLWVGYGRTLLLEKAGVTISAALIGASRPQAASKSTVTNSLLGQFGFSITDVLKIAVQIFGNSITLIAVAGFVLLGCAVLQRRGAPSQLTVYHAALVLLPPFVMVGEFATDALPGLGFKRLLRPSLYVAPVVAGGVVWFYQRYSGRLGSMRSIIALVVVVSAVATPVMLAGANHYDDPDWTLSVNSYRSDSEVAGYSWFFSKKQRGMRTEALWRRPTRVAGDLLGRSESRKRRSGLGGGRNDRVPRHFGNGTLGGTNGTFYFVDGRRDRATLLDALSESGRLNRTDLRRLQTDPTVAKIYANGDLNVSVVTPRSKPAGGANET